MSSMPQCPHCGRWSANNKPCEAVCCLGCGTVQCFLNGGARGTCSVCHFGILPGWSGSNCTCAYKGCGAQANYRYVPRMGNVCYLHSKRAKVQRMTLEEYVKQRRANIPGWVRGIR